MDQTTFDTLKKQPLQRTAGGAVFRVAYRVACFDFSLIF